MKVRRLAPQDAEEYRALRLEALREEPAAFGACLSEEMCRPLSWFGETLGRSAVFAAMAPQGPLAGMLGLQRDGMSKRQHIAHVRGMYVRPGQRGRGVGAALLSAVIGHARGQVAVLQLVVGAANPGAIRLYQTAGFEVYGTERASLRVAGVDADSLLMALHLPG